MSKVVNVNLKNFEVGIQKLQKLQKKINEPRISKKKDLVKSSKASLGDVKSSLCDFVETTQNYYKILNALVTNTISYMEYAKDSFKNTDKTIAKKISGEK